MAVRKPHYEKETVDESVFRETNIKKENPEIRSGKEIIRRANAFFRLIATKSVDDIVNLVKKNEEYLLYLPHLIKLFRSWKVAEILRKLKKYYPLKIRAVNNIIFYRMIKEDYNEEKWKEVYRETYKDGLIYFLRDWDNYEIKSELPIKRLENIYKKLRKIIPQKELDEFIKKESVEIMDADFKRYLKKIIKK